LRGGELKMADEEHSLETERVDLGIGERLGAGLPLHEWRTLTDPWRTPSVRMTMLFAGLYLVLRMWLPTVGGLPESSAKLLSILVFVTLTFLIAYHAARMRLGLRAQLGGLAGALIVWLALSFLLRPTPGTQVVAAAAGDLAFMLCCVFFGVILARAFRDRNILLPASLAVALVDLIGVYYGLTGRLLQDAPELVANLSVKLPTIGGAPGTAVGAGSRVLATMGGGDIVFIAVFFAAAVRLEMNVRGTFWYVYPLSILAMILALFVPGLVGIPALPFVVAGFLACNFHYFDLTPGERWAMLYAGLVVLVVILLCVFAARYV